jgi:hypothetical protein
MLTSLFWFRERIPYDMFYSAVYDLRCDMLEMEKSLTPEDLARVPDMRVASSGVIHTCVLQAAERDRQDNGATRFDMWSYTSAEDYLGSMYDKATDILLWHTDNTRDAV